MNPGTDPRPLRAAVLRGTGAHFLTTAVAAPVFLYGLGVAAAGDPIADLPLTILRLSAAGCGALFALNTLVLIPATFAEARKADRVAEREAVAALVGYVLAADVLALLGLYAAALRFGGPREGWGVLALFLVPAGVGAWRYATVVCRAVRWAAETTDPP